jgi:hypothetical protein
MLACGWLRSCDDATTMMKVTRTAAFALYYNHYHGVWCRCCFWCVLRRRNDDWGSSRSLVNTVAHGETSKLLTLCGPVFKTGGRVFNETINPNTSVWQRKSCEMCPWPGRVIRTTRWCVDDKLNSICLSKRATWESINRRLQLYTAALLENVCNAKKTNAFPLRRKRFINFIPISF